MAAGGAEPRAWMLVLHGVFGSGSNWRTFARAVTDRRPDWGLALVDLRMHGASQAAPPPHTLAAAARDLGALSAELAGAGRQVRAVCGHSFGGKVALAARADAIAAAGEGDAATADGAGWMREEDVVMTWILDSSPSARPEAMDDPDNTVVSVLRTLERLPARFSSRRAFVEAFAAAHQAGERGAGGRAAVALGQWLAMNLERDRDAGDYASRLDLGAIRALLTDYYARDLWSAVPAGPGDVHVVVAGRGSALSKDDRARLAELSRESDRVAMTELADAGHWLHIDALPALIDVIAPGLPRV